MANSEYVTLFNAVVRRNHPIVYDAVKGILAVDSSMVDPEIMDAAGVTLGVEAREGNYNLTISCGGAFVAVTVRDNQGTDLPPVELASALPSKRKLSTLIYHPDGKVTEADGKTVVERNSTGRQELANVVHGAIRGLEAMLK